VRRVLRRAARLDVTAGLRRYSGSLRGLAARPVARGAAPPPRAPPPPPRTQGAEAAAAALYLPCAGQVPLARVAFEGNGNVIEALPLQNCRVLFT